MMEKAFRLSLPILWAYLFLGFSYGLVASSMGYPVWISLSMAMAVYSGSVEFIALTILCRSFQPLSAFIMALIVGARHIFYGISMLGRWREAGWRKPFLIFWMSDETFAVNYANGGSIPQQFWVSLFDYLYWIIGGLAGYFIGNIISDEIISHMRGIEFVVTAMFVALFMDDYMRNKPSRRSAWMGIGISSLCLIAFGASRFVIPSMLAILIVQYITYRQER